MTEENYYKILQVDPEADMEVIVSAYKRLAAKYHPDVNKSLDAEKRMKAINEAYEVLCNPEKRASYDFERGFRKSTGKTKSQKDKPNRSVTEVHDTSNRGKLTKRVPQWVKWAVPILLLSIIAVVILLVVFNSNGGGDSDGSTTTESGLGYIEIEEGEGLMVKPGDVVEVHYTGTLEDGTKFDSSLDRGQPISFTVGKGEMIPGFDEGVGLMKEGGKARLVIPPEIGYGEAGSGGAVPPNATITFEVELLTIDRPDPPQEVAETDYEVLDNGSKYYDFQVGDGESPEYGEAVVIHFTMWSDDGIRLQDSVEMGQPAIVPMQQGMQPGGLVEGILTMSVDGKRQLVIPPELAFGDKGDLVNPNPTLIVEVQLLAVIDAPEPAEQTQVAEKGYTTKESGLKYYDLHIGEGASPGTGQFAAIHYTGWLTDGTQFDSSIDRGAPLPVTLGVGQMINGLEEGLAEMKMGGKRQIVIPPDLGYKDQGVSGIIPPNATLIFEMELVYIYQAME